MTLTKKDTVLILSHFYKRAADAGGPPQEVRDFLVPKVGTVVYIEHPFPYADDHRSSMTIYKAGVQQSIRYTRPLAGPQAFFYVADIFITWYFLWQARQQYTLCVALDNLNTLSVLPFRWFGQIKRLVFYTIDYTPRRFTQWLLNKLYLIADRWACQTADTIWILSDRMIKARRQMGVKTPKNEQSIVLPMGAKLARIKPLSYDKIKRQQLIFVGHLLEKQGLQLIIEALPSLIKSIPKLKLVVVGQGEYQATLKSLASQLKVEQYIDWRGFVQTHEAVEQLLCQSAIGLAPYIPSPDNYTFYTDPGKPKLYLGCGLPVIITDYPASAQLIAKHEAGFIIQPTADSIGEALRKLLTDDSLYKRYRANALTLAKEFDTDVLISRAISQTHDQ